MGFRLLLLVFIWNLALSAMPLLGADDGNAWADRNFHRLSDRGRIGQLFIVPFEDRASAKKLIERYQVGGFVLPQGKPEALQSDIQWLQQQSDIPLWIILSSQDGLNPALTGAIALPKALTVLSIDDPILVAELGYSTGQLIDAIGANMHQISLENTSFESGLMRSGVPLLNPRNAYSGTVLEYENRQHYPLTHLQISNESSPEKLVTSIRNSTDLLLLSSGAVANIDSYISAIEEAKFKKKEWRAIVKKGLLYKSQLIRNRPYTQELDEFIFRKDRSTVLYRILRNSFAYRRGAAGTLPIQRLEDNYFAVVRKNRSSSSEFAGGLGRYVELQEYYLEDFENNPSRLAEYLGLYDWVIMDLTEVPDQNYCQRLWRELPDNQQVVVFANGLLEESFIPYQFHVLWNYENVPLAKDLASQMIFGALPVTGKFPEALGLGWEASKTTDIGRLRYAYPELVGMDSDELLRVNDLMQEAISTKATPGGQVMVAKNGTVIFNKAYGYHTYDSLLPVSNETLFDVASISKTAATLQAVMFLSERGVLNIEAPLKTYFEELQDNPKGELIIKEILAHQSGLPSYYPFWRNTVDRKKGYLEEFYHEQYEEAYNRSVVPGLYVSDYVEDSLWQWIISDQVKLKEEKEYLYSDIGFMILHRLCEQLLNQPMEEFLDQNFYQSLGLNTLCYNPLCRFSEYQVAPTEVDLFYRNGKIWGYVHDQNAALLGGVAGHAGLFSNANDLMKLMQMHLQEGYYGGRSYFQNSTVQEFTRAHYPQNRRGLGWDKPDFHVENTSQYCSSQTFGHTGFTGTAVWADPEEELVFIFLSNRTYPDASNNKLLRENVRTRIQDVVYESIIRYAASDD